MRRCSSLSRSSPQTRVPASLVSWWQERRDACPLCHVARRAEEAHLRWFVNESYGDPATLEHLLLRSYCSRHAGELLTGDTAQLTVTAEFLLRVEAATLTRFRARLEGERRAQRRRETRRRLPARAEVLDDPDHCPACAAGGVACAVAASELCELLGDADGRAVYREQPGLCRRHLWRLLQEAPAELAVWLAQSATDRIGQVLEDLGAYFDVLGGRRSREDAGGPLTAWRGALRHLWGDPPWRSP